MIPRIGEGPWRDVQLDERSFNPGSLATKFIESRRGQKPLIVAEIYAELKKPRFPRIEDGGLGNITHDTGSDYNVISRQLVQELGIPIPNAKGRTGPGPGSGGLLRAIWQPEIHGSINGISVSALADSGSCVNAMSEQFATQHDFAIEDKGKCEIRLPSGGSLTTVGTAMVDFKFSGEKEMYRNCFHVLKSSFYDVVLGKPFLDSTRTLTDFTKRITRALSPCLRSGDRLFLLGDPQQSQITCTVNGRQGSAIADTGSELMIVFGDFVRKHRLRVHRKKRHRRVVSFIDGSTALTDGMVLGAHLKVNLPDLPYGTELHYPDYIDRMLKLPMYSTSRKHSKFIYDLHVLENLPYDIILSNQFIYDHNIFSRQTYAKKVLTFLHHDAGVLKGQGEPALCVIRLSRKERRYVTTHRPMTAWAAWEGFKNREMHQREVQADRIMALPWIEQVSTREVEKRRQEEWARNNKAPSAGGPSTLASAQPPQAPSSMGRSGVMSPLFLPTSVPFPPGTNTQPARLSRPGANPASVPSPLQPSLTIKSSPSSITTSPSIAVVPTTPTTLPTQSSETSRLVPLISPLVPSVSSPEPLATSSAPQIITRLPPINSFVDPTISASLAS